MSKAAHKLLQIAQVLKSNGIDGELVMSFRDIDPEDIPTSEPVFIYFDGLPVPFFIEQLTPRGLTKALVHLTDIESNEDAEEILGAAVYMDESIFEDETDEEDFSFLIGWEVEGVGEILDFVDIPSNPCIEVAAEGGSVMLPLHEDLIKSLDEKRRVISLEIPDGLLNI